MSPAPFCKACLTPLNVQNTLGRKNNYDLVQCGHCGTVTVNPFPTVEELISFYQQYQGSTDYKRKAAKKIKRARGRIARLMKLTEGKDFLDVGCNYGFTVKAARDLGLNAKGIDIDQDAINISRQDFGKDHYAAVSVQEYATAGHKADIIYTSEVIEHVPDPDSFVAAIAKILHQGGVLYLTTPDAGHFRVPKNFVEWNDVMPPEHITYFTRKGMKHLLEKHGLKVKGFAFNLKPGIKVTAVKL